MKKQVRTRFAPSPTGFIHVGGAYGALLDYAWAKKNKGKFILRIEDTDKRRFVKGAEEAILQGLAWLGIKPDEGPYRQSERLEIYKRYAEELVKKGHAYFCFCSPKRLAKIREEKKFLRLPPMYDRHCRSLSKKEIEKNLAAGKNYVIRMKIPLGQKIVVNDLLRGKIIFDSDLVDDQVILKSDGFPTYHLAVVVDDHLMKISHTIRGEEWLSSAPKHVLLYQYLNWQPPVFVHTPTLRNPDRSKLSKRKGHVSLDWYKEKGFLPEALRNFLCLLGWSHPKQKEIFSLEEFIRLFNLKDLSPIGPVFNLEKLLWMNGEYIRSKNDKELAELLSSFLPKMTKKQIAFAVPLIKERIKTLSEAKELLEFVWQKVNYPKEWLLGKEKMVDAAREIIKKHNLSETEKIQKEMMSAIKKNNWKVGDFFMVLRIAVCGKKITPPILEALPLLPKEEVLVRLKV